MKATCQKISNYDFRSERVAQHLFFGVSSASGILRSIDEKAVPPAYLNRVKLALAAISPPILIRCQWQIVAESSNRKLSHSICLELSFVTFLGFKTKKSKRLLRTSMATFKKLLSSDLIKFRQDIGFQ